MNNQVIRLLWTTRNRWWLWAIGWVSLMLFLLPGAALSYVGGVLEIVHDHIMAQLRKLANRHYPPTKEALAVVAEIVEAQDALDEAAEQDRDEVRALLRHPNEFN